MVEGRRASRTHTNTSSCEADTQDITPPRPMDNSEPTSYSSLTSSDSAEDFSAGGIQKRRRTSHSDLPKAEIDGSKRPAQPIRTTEAAPIRCGSQEDQPEGEVTLVRCLHLLRHGDKDLRERPANILQELVPTQLFAETPKQKRTASRWGSDTVKADRWANSGGVSGSHDYFPGAQAPGEYGVRKRYGRIVRATLPYAPRPPPPARAAPTTRTTRTLTPRRVPQPAQVLRIYFTQGRR